jgi:predicted transglutaminase-like cysteine proteinase
MRAVFRYLARLAVALALFSVGAAPAFAGQVLSPQSIPGQHPRIFGNIEIYSPDVAPFWKWTTMLARYHDELRHVRHVCRDGEWSGCEPAEWRHLVKELRGLDLRAKLDRVNAEINRHPYVRSIDNWGNPNYWETPFEFLKVGGQCQDYAITKYLLLRAAGVDEDDLRVVVVRDMNLQLDHAILVVFVDGGALVLDNQIGRVLPATLIHHYRPYYSINEAGWWRHIPVRRELPPTVVAAGRDKQTAEIDAQ